MARAWSRLPTFLTGSSFCIASGSCPVDVHSFVLFLFPSFISTSHFLPPFHFAVAAPHLPVFLAASSPFLTRSSNRSIQPRSGNRRRRWWRWRRRQPGVQQLLYLLPAIFADSFAGASVAALLWGEKRREQQIDERGGQPELRELAAHCSTAKSEEESVGLFRWTIGESGERRGAAEATKWQRDQSGLEAADVFFVKHPRVCLFHFLIQECERIHAIRSYQELSLVYSYEWNFTELFVV